MIGTDGEEALIDAFTHEFGFFPGSDCFNEKVREYNIPQLSVKMLNDVFGKKVGTAYVEDLVNADDFDKAIG